MDGLQKHNGNGMIETARETDRREGNRRPYNLFADPDYLLEVAADLARERANNLKGEGEKRA
ncbi:MAG: hypothetical protein ACHQYP_05950 [Nitrospiria bacterium]